MDHPLLLEIAAWPWLERLAASAGSYVTLENVPAEAWDRIAADGFDLLFLMGVWSRSSIGRELARSDPGMMREYDRALPGWTPADVPGSPYCIDRYEPDARMGGWPGLDAARRELRNRGVGLILDFVPNHTGFDHRWIEQHPRRYVLGTDEDVRSAPADFRTMDSVEGRVHVACGRDPYFPPWRDVAQLNFFNPDTRQAMRRVLRALSDHCDGLRCDMAMLAVNDVFERTWRGNLHGDWPRLPDEFWPAATRGTPGLIYLAEVYWNMEGLLLEQGFTFAYDKRLLDALHAPDAAARIRQLLLAGDPPPSGLARFLENHDEPRSAATLADRLPAAVALAATVPGMRFFFDGQQDGRRIRSPVQLARWAEETIDGGVRAIYDAALSFAAGPVLHHGECEVLEAVSAGDDTFRTVLSYRWRTAAETALVIVNLGPTTAQANISGVADSLPAGEAFIFEDALTGVPYRWAREPLERSGLYVRLQTGGAHLFNVHAAA